MLQSYKRVFDMDLSSVSRIMGCNPDIDTLTATSVTMFLCPEMFKMFYQVWSFTKYFSWFVSITGALFFKFWNYNLDLFPSLFKN